MFFLYKFNFGILASHTLSFKYTLYFSVLNCRDGQFSSIVIEPPKLQCKFSKMLFSYVRKSPHLHNCNSKSRKFKKLTKVGLLRIVFNFFIFPVFFTQ